ncbi:nitrate- and nitrite sensing domain-containing protein [Streptomyces sp. ISL-11]|uniref:sensor histidine kinase n=1 Tax=Streptomyces sp. ISL-11 TaxID=2819174 RepID=UPI001BEA5C9C|nr:nitrate- and nitrite sensing domain-containing protein [Streptomyces sp. ISL-11]MBT2382028.1 nitrate- and nitrite sensing domain-containing protein [Streptomyces sp. ISL-11]
MRERTARVRNRLTASVAVAALAVLGAGAFGVVDASRELTGDRRLVALAEDAGPALALAHVLADERDAMTRYVAAGRSGAPEAGLSDAQRAEVQRRIEEYRPAAPASLRRLLDAIPEARTQALAADGGDALAAFAAYTTTVRELHAVADTVEGPAGSGPAALLPLGRAVEEASATRALLLGALAAHGTQQSALAAAAQRSAQRERDALDDFRRLAGTGARERFTGTVTGPGVTAADGHLARLARSQPSAADLADQPPGPVRTALTDRVERMRQVESGLAAQEKRRLEGLRDDARADVELRGGASALCLLIALGAGLRTTRSVTRPLDTLRLGARRVCADPAAEQPVALTGRDDEIAEIVRAVNVLRETAHRQRERIAVLEGERTRLVTSRQIIAEEREALRDRHQQLSERLAEELAEPEPAAVRTDGPADRAHGLLVGLSLRTLGLVERQLAVIEGLEAHETDPERLETLFTLDHLATRMRRNSENLLAIAGAESGSARTAPVPLLDVLRASAGEIERYQRVRIQSLPPHALLAGYASDDVSHLVAELLENATAFSPADSHVQLSGWTLETGEIVLSVQDEGIGITADRLGELNALLADPDPEGPRAPGAPTGRADLAGHPEQQGDPGRGLGLYVVARLAGRHGVRVQLREQMTGGTAALVVLPLPVLADGSPTVTGLADTPLVPGAAAAPRIHLPGSIAEANSHALPGRPQRTADVRAIPSPVPVHPADPPAGPAGGPIRVTGLPAAPAAVMGRHARPPEAGAPVVGNGLPKRTPKAVPHQPAPPPVRKSVDAEALRRKLSGFQRGATEGRRVAEAEAAGRITDRNQAGLPATGGTVEEARG